MNKHTEWSPTSICFGPSCVCYIH